jgi:hypothetical protein
LVRAKHARGRTVRGTPGTAALVYLVLTDLRDTHGHVRITNGEIARAIGMDDPNTVRSNVHLLVAAGLLYPPVRTHDEQGYIDGMDYALRPDPAAYSVTDPQQILPFRSSTKSSSARSAPPARPLDPVEWKFVAAVGFDLAYQHQPPRLPDRATLETKLLALNVTASDDAIATALADIARELQRQQQLGLVGLTPDQRPRRDRHPRRSPQPHPSIGTDRLWRRLYAEQDALKVRRA